VRAFEVPCAHAVRRAPCCASSPFVVAMHWNAGGCSQAGSRTTMLIERLERLCRNARHMVRPYRTSLWRGVVQVKEYQAGSESP